MKFALHAGVGVLPNEQRTGGVPDEEREAPFARSFLFLNAPALSARNCVVTLYQDNK